MIVLGFLLYLNFVHVVLIAINRSLEQLEDDLVVVAVLAVGLSVVRHDGVLHGEQMHVEHVDLAGVGPQHLVAVLVHPRVEDGGEEVGVAGLHLLLVGLGGFIEVVLHGVADHQQVLVQSLHLLEGPVDAPARRVAQSDRTQFHLLPFFLFLGVLVAVFAFEQVAYRLTSDQLLTIVGDEVVEPEELRKEEGVVEDLWVFLVPALLILEDMAEEDDLELVHVEQLDDLEEKDVGVALDFSHLVEYFVGLESDAALEELLLVYFILRLRARWLHHSAQIIISQLLTIFSLLLSQTSNNYPGSEFIAPFLLLLLLFYFIILFYLNTIIRAHSIAA